MLTEALKVIEGNVSAAGIRAATTGPVANGHKEYIHVWPRDAVLTALEWRHYSPQWAYDSLESVCRLSTNSNGLLYQRYELDGRPDDLAWTNFDGTHQVDQDALKLVGASVLPKSRLNSGLIEKLHFDYVSLVNYASSSKSSTDVWEQKQGYFFYTSSALLWGLKAARQLFGKNLAPKHAELEGRLRASIRDFYNPALACFVKSPTEPAIDLEVVLGIVTLFEADTFGNSSWFVEKTLNTLGVFERDLMQPVGGGFAPIRYKGDFWDGERVGPAGIGRPWPMGTALLSSAYSMAALNAGAMGDEATFNYSSLQGMQWFAALQKIPHARHFAEQVDSNGNLPKSGPVGLSWAASEYLRARRLTWATR